MRKGKKILILFLIVFLLCGCNRKYKGYWCNYRETATLVVLLEDNTSEEQKKVITKTIDGFDNVSTMNYYSKDDYASELNENPEQINIYDTYVILFDSLNSIGTYADELKKVSGVLDVTQASAKSNISLYNLKGNHKYTFTDSDEAQDDDLLTGKYKIKNGVITFTPSKGGKTTLLYMKDEYLCGDVDCKQIFAKSNSTCTTSKEE